LCSFMIRWGMWSVILLMVTDQYICGLVKNSLKKFTSYASIFWCWRSSSTWELWRHLILLAWRYYIIDWWKI
jgi:hypothetical protein